MSSIDTNTDQETAAKLKSLELLQRPEHSLTGRFIYWAGVLFALVHIYFNTLSTVSELWVSAIHFGGFAMLCALMVPMVRSSTVAGRRVTLILDILLGCAAVICALYLIGFEDALYARGVKFDDLDWVFSLCAIFIALEMARRTTGWFIPCMILVALTYVFWWGQYIDGIFGFPGLSLETLLYRSYFSSEGMFGQIARISWTYVFMFILFGAFLVKSGAGDFIIELSRCAAGRMVGVKVGGSISRLLYNPDDPFCLQREADDKKYTLDHFFIKLLHIAQSMNTPSAKAEALRRTEYMHDFLEQLKSEIGEQREYT